MLWYFLCIFGIFGIFGQDLRFERRVRLQLLLWANGGAWQQNPVKYILYNTHFFKKLFIEEQKIRGICYNNTDLCYDQFGCLIV